jgi:hypothetical protein
METKWETHLHTHTHTHTEVMLLGTSQVFLLYTSNYCLQKDQCDLIQDNKVLGRRQLSDMSQQMSCYENTVKYN